MGQRTELTLGMIILLGLFGAGVIIWGQQTGRLQIFGDTASIGETVPIVVPASSSSVLTTISESFESLTLADQITTTAFWNLDAGEATLQPGTIEGVIQSLTVNKVTGASVTARLRVDDYRPVGSDIIYAISADGGATWSPFSVGHEVTVAAPAGDWRWKALLKRGAASLNPVVSDVTITLVTK